MLQDIFQVILKANLKGNIPIILFVYAFLSIFVCSIGLPKSNTNNNSISDGTGNLSKTISPSQIYTLDTMEQTSGLYYDKDTDLLWIVEDGSSKNRTHKIFSLKRSTLLHQTEASGNLIPENAYLYDFSKDIDAIDIEGIGKVSSDTFVISIERTSHGIATFEIGADSKIKNVKSYQLQLEENHGNSGIEGIDFLAKAATIYAGIEGPPGIFTFTFPLIDALNVPTRKIDISNLAQSLCELKVVEEQGKVFFWILDRNRSKLLKIADQDVPEIKSTYNLVFKDIYECSYQASPEGFTFIDDKTLVVVTDPWIGHYTPDDSDCSNGKNQYIYEKNLPMIYVYNL